MLDDKAIDIVTIATPNHWHALAAIWAMQAGKDVYVEKPVSHNVSEGRRVVKSAAKHKRICQAGTQSRSTPGMHEAIEFLRAGKLGKVKLARGLCYKLRGRRSGQRGSTRFPRTSTTTSGAARRRSSRSRAQTVPLRLALALGLRQRRPRQPGHPPDGHRPLGPGQDRAGVGVLSLGGRFGYDDDGETANTQVAIHEFANGKTLVFEVRGLETAPLLKWTQKNSKGEESKEQAMCRVLLRQRRRRWSARIIHRRAVFDPKGKLVTTFGGGGDHFGNFLKAVRSRERRRTERPRSSKGTLQRPVPLGQHFAIALGDLHSPGEALERLKALKTNDNVQETLDRMISHLSDNKVKFDDRTELRIGPSLAFDPKSETFVNNSQADAFLTRDYRAPFVVPSADAV